MLRSRVRGEIIVFEDVEEEEDEKVDILLLKFNIGFLLSLEILDLIL